MLLLENTVGEIKENQSLISVIKLHRILHARVNITLTACFCRVIEVRLLMHTFSDAHFLSFFITFTISSKVIVALAAVFCTN